MFCTNCGEQMRDTDKFCAACGAKAAPPTRRRAEIQETAAEQAAAAVPEAVQPPAERRPEPEVVAAPAPIAPPPVSSTADFTARPAQAREHRAPAPQQMNLAAAAKMQEAKAAADEQRRALLEAEEMAAVRDLVPLEMLPDEFPLKQPVPAPAVEPQRAAVISCPNCGRLNSAIAEYCETCGREMRAEERPTTSVDVSPSWLHDQQPAKRSEPVRPPAPQVGIIPQVSATDPPQTVPDSFSYVYDDNVATKGNRSLLYVLVGVLALGVIGVLYLVLRPSSKPAHAVGNVAIRISPQQANVSPGAAYDFAATVTGTGNSDVTWTVQEGNAGGKLVERGAQAHGGEVASMAVYVAPPNPGTYHVVASSKADPTKSATADVIVSGQ